MKSASAKKSHKKLIVALAAGIGGILLIVAAIFLLASNRNIELGGGKINMVGGGKINNLAELKSAIKNRKAVNCQLSDTTADKGSTILLQANDGWSKAHVKVETADSYPIESWYVADGAKMTAYIATKQDAIGMEADPYSLNFKESGKLRDLQNQAGSSDGDYLVRTKNLKCAANNLADFAAPNREWESFSLGDGGTDTYLSASTNDATDDDERQTDALVIADALNNYSATSRHSAFPPAADLHLTLPDRDPQPFGGFITGKIDKITKIVSGVESLAIGNTAAIQLGADCEGLEDTTYAAIYVAQEIYEPKSPHCTAVLY